MMRHITARLRGVPEAQASRQAIQVSRGRQPSSGAPCAHQHECDGPEAIANLARTKRMRVVQGLRVSQRGNLNADNADRLARGAVDQLQADLATLANSPVFSLTSAARVVMFGAAVCIDGRHAVGEGLGEGCVDAVKGGHVCVSRFDNQNIGPMVLHVNRGNA